MAVIFPTVGRIVWFTPAPGDARFPHQENHDNIYAAIVARVWSPILVNLAVFHCDGHTIPVTGVNLVQNGVEHPTHVAFCQWMPYQIAQAAKHSPNESSDNEVRKTAPVPEPLVNHDPEPAPAGPADQEKSPNPVT